MLRQECRKGMRVYFGSKNGEKTLGEIVKLNLTSAKIKVLEQRGHGRGSEFGSLWNVHYALIYAKTMPEVPNKKLIYSQFQPQEEIHILQAIACIYSELSPENLSCDGELPTSEVNRKRVALHLKLKCLQDALGRTVSEHEITEWERERRAAFKVSETEE